MNAKVAFKNTIQGKNESGLLFIPFAYGLAAKMANITLRQMVGDPTYYAYSLEGAYKLFHYHAIINHFDTSIEAESCGCQLEWRGEFEPPVVTSGCDIFRVGPEDFVKSGRIPVLLEMSKRLVMSLGREIAIVGVLTGPCSLMNLLQGKAIAAGKDDAQDAISLAGSLLTRFVRSLCELRVDAIFVREDLLGKNFYEELLRHRDSYKAIYATLFNIIRAYNSYPLVILKELSLEAIGDLHALLKPRGIVLCGRRLDEGDLIFLKDLSDSLKMCFGLPLPVGVGDQDDLWNQMGVIQSFVKKHGPKGFFYTSDGEIPHQVPLDTVHDLISRL
jgi:hypothetical protein